MGTPTPQPQHCPRCGLISPPKAHRCDCGYDFLTATVAFGTKSQRRESLPHVVSGVVTSLVALALGTFGYVLTPVALWLAAVVLAGGVALIVVGLIGHEPR